MQESNNKYTIVISEQTEERLTVHTLFLAKVNKDAALKLLQEFETAVKSLETFPERNPCFSAFITKPKKYRKLLIAKRYLLVYQIKDNTVYVDELFDCRQHLKFSWLIKDN